MLDGKILEDFRGQRPQFRPVGGQHGVHAVPQFGYADRQDFYAEPLGQFALVAGNAQEGRGARTDLQDAHMPDGGDHARRAQEAVVARFEIIAFGVAVGEISKAHAVARKDFAQGEQTALRIAQAQPRLVRTFVARSPQEHGNVEGARHLADRTFLTEIAQGNEQRLDVVRAKAVDDLGHVLERPEQSFFVDAVDIDQRGVGTTNHALHQIAVSAGFFLGKHRAARGEIPHAKRSGDHMCLLCGAGRRADGRTRRPGQPMKTTFVDSPFRRIPTRTARRRPAR